MYRSFTDRILGGVCGGLGQTLPVLNGWAVRGLFVVLTVVTVGAFGLVYALLWLVVPQESLAIRGRGGLWWLLFALGLMVAVPAAWYGQLNGLTQTPDGVELFWPGLVLFASVVFFLKQLGRGAAT